MDLKVRQAVASAIDPKQIDVRAYGGKGVPGSELFQSTFNNSPGVPGPKYDVEAAKKFVADAKAAGWDGKLQYETDKAPANGETALAIQAMLGSVGISVEVKQVDSGVLATDKRNGNYQLASHGFNITDDDMGAARNITANLVSTSSTNRLGYKSPDMDAALDQLKAARTGDEKKAAYKRVADAYVRDAPFLVLAAVEERPTWNASVQGVVTNLESMLLFDKAWLKK
jgi:peptide/nickel transport system substrate-binding protein